MNRVKIIKQGDYDSDAVFETEINEVLEELEDDRADIKKVFLTAEPVTCLIWYEARSKHKKRLSDTSGLGPTY